jgi:hypothetical protein
MATDKMLFSSSISLKRSDDAFEQQRQRHGQRRSDAHHRQPTQYGTKRQERRTLLVDEPRILDATYEIMNHSGSGSLTVSYSSRSALSRVVWLFQNLTQRQQWRANHACIIFYCMGTVVSETLLQGVNSQHDGSRRRRENVPKMGFFVCGGSS